MVIGSGVTGASVSRTVLREGARRGGAVGEGDGGERRVVMLEARSVCSGATGRNGGHVKVSPWEVVRALELRGIRGERARKIVEFQRRHLGVLLELCKAEGIEAAELREVETVDLFMHGEGWEEAKECMKEMEKGMEDVDWGLKVWEGEEAREVSGLCFLNASRLMCGLRSFARAVTSLARFLSELEHSGHTAWSHLSSLICSQLIPRRSLSRRARRLRASV